MKIDTFVYVRNFYERHLGELMPFISNIDVKVLSINDWPDGKTLTTYSDGSIINILSDYIYNDINIGWLIHEVGHVLQNNGLDSKASLVNKLLIMDYPNADNEQVAWYWQYRYFFDRNYTKEIVLYLFERSYNNTKGGKSLWDDNKEIFFSKYYENFKNIIIDGIQ